MQGIRTYHCQSQSHSRIPNMGNHHELLLDMAITEDRRSNVTYIYFKILFVCKMITTLERVSAYVEPIINTGRSRRLLMGRTALRSLLGP